MPAMLTKFSENEFIKSRTRSSYAVQDRMDMLPNMCS